MCHTRFSLIIVAHLAAFISAAAIFAQPMSPEATLLRLDEVLWREVQTPQGEGLGAISDVLVQMPSGRIVFVAVDPAELFERPRVVPPGVLMVPTVRESPVQLNVSMDRWIDAPRLDWDAALVIKNTMEGIKIYGYYQETWREPDSSPPWGLNVVASPQGAPQAERYVSLKDLLLNRVVAGGGQHAGYVRGFVIDWSAKRVTHALVSAGFRLMGAPESRWFAIPVALINPPLEDAISVNSSLETFRRASTWPAGGKNPPGDASTIYRYPG